MFWGANLKQGEFYEFKNLAGKVLTISNACLGKNTESGKYYLSLNTNKNNQYM